jgi:pyruvate dehydrogenase E1 component alpha subunit
MPAPVRYLDPAGRPCGKLPAAAADPDILLALYRALLRGQRQWRALAADQAVAIAIASVLQPDDLLLPDEALPALALWRDQPLPPSMGASGRDGSRVGALAAARGLQALGAAYALKLRGRARAAVLLAGDAPGDAGQLDRALAQAARWQVPALFVHRRPAPIPRCGTRADGCVAAGMPAAAVDGGDVIALRVVAAGCLERARSGGGPSLIEVWPAPAPSDLGALAPADRLRACLQHLGIWSSADDARLRARLDRPPPASPPPRLRLVARRDPPMPPAHAWPALRPPPAEEGGHAR